MSKRVKRRDFEDFAASHGLEVRKEMGGYRLERDGSYVFPSDGICPVTTMRECIVFLMGMGYAAKIRKRKERHEPVEAGQTNPQAH